jgi:colanic acid biosynthesis glycosyl transferase WcaI
MAKTSTPSKLYTIMAAGRAVVAAADPGSDVARVVEAAGCGICVPPEDPPALADALDTLARDASNTHVLGARGRAYVEHAHSRGSVGQQYEDLMTRLVVMRRGTSDAH